MSVMNIAGIVSEFNPFHKGHKYLIDETKKKGDVRYVIAIMSGNYVERGEPAVLDMGLRASAALNSGCDMVFELPPGISVSSAEGFARGAVGILDSLGIDTLSFGSECGNIEDLMVPAGILAKEPESYKIALSGELSSGLSFPSAREKALLSVLKTLDIDNPEYYTGILRDPNNILAVEYLKALILSGSGIKPFTTKRVVSGYHKSSGETPDPSESSCYSAEKIRDIIYNGRSFPEGDTCLNYLKDALMINGTVNPDSLSILLCEKLLSGSLFDDLNSLKIPSDLARRIVNNSGYVGSFTGFIELLKSKNITYTAISRYLLRLSLNIPSFDGTIPGYVRLLGFRMDAKDGLKAIKDRSKITILTNSSDIREYLDHGKDAPGLKTHLRVDRTYELLRSDEKRRVHPLPPEIARKLIVV